MKIFSEKPPFFLEWLLKVFLRNDENFQALGDFDEIYCKLVKTKGAINALRWYIFQIIEKF